MLIRKASTIAFLGVCLADDGVPFVIVRCRWPRPVRQVNGCWTSEPEWDAPIMPFSPKPAWMTIGGEECWAIDWRAFFRAELRYRERCRLCGQSFHTHLGGEMRGFHIVFTLRFTGSGKFIFWDDDGSIIRRNASIVHTDRSAHPLRQSELDVTAGDHIDIAQWQHFGDWIWGGRLISRQTLREEALAVLGSYTPTVVERLYHAQGPPLKMYLHGQAPLRTILGIYSMVLNGYSPSEIILFGESPWPSESRDLFAVLLPFVRIVRHQSVIDHLDSLGAGGLVKIAQRYWFVMKMCIALLLPPSEFCLMDDDVLILDRVDDALSAFEKADLVFSQDMDHGVAYQRTWGQADSEQILGDLGRFNAGLYWGRVRASPRELAARAVSISPDSVSSFVWEQGFIANSFRGLPVHALPSQRFFYPLFDGLPGGLMGYDYRSNPCGFASLHFGGSIEKPSESMALALAQDILDRSSHCEAP